MNQPKEKEKPSPDNLRGSYEEMFSNWKNKMPETFTRIGKRLRKPGWGRSLPCILWMQKGYLPAAVGTME